MIIINGRIYGADKQFHTGTVKISNERIVSVEYTKDASTIQGDYSEDADTICIDAYDGYVIPGLIDIHLHGAMGYDIGDASLNSIEAIAGYELTQGVTGFLGATMTMPIEDTFNTIDNALDYINQQGPNGDLSSLIGLNVEGPFISPDKCGAQNSAHIRKPDLTLARQMLKRGNGIIKILGLAPEMCDDISIISKLTDLTKVAITHSNSNYDIALMSILNGASHVTHLFNGMSGFTHRNPGILGALTDSKDVTIELITDGIHVHPATVRMAYKLFGNNNLILISDSMRGCGLGDGVYTLGDIPVSVKNGKATIQGSENPAGSVSSLYYNVKIAYNMGIPLESVVAMSTINPAKCIGMDSQIGSLETGKLADILILDNNLNIENVIKSGKIH